MKLLRFRAVENIDNDASRRGRRVITWVVLITLIPAAVMTVNIVRKNMFERGVRAFVLAELNYSGTQILSTHAENDTLRVVAVGREITDASLVEARDRMKFYGLEDLQLVVIQASNDESFALATSQLNSAEQANTLLSSQLADLQRQLSAYTVYDTLSVHVSDEARTLFPSVKSVSVGRLGGKPVALVACGEGQSLNAEATNHLENWLRVRLKENSLDIIIK